MEKSLLQDATSADDSPAPGYMLADISKSTLSSYPACVQLQEYLLNRLKKDNHNIKYKCLVIIKYVCRTGRAEFKKEMGRNIAPIKDCLQFRGPPDPLRGDIIYSRVRDAAKEAIDAIYDSQMPVTTSAVAAANRIQGMGGGEDMDRPRPSQGSYLSNMSSALASLRENEASGYVGHAGATSSFNVRDGNAGSFSSSSSSSSSSYNPGGGGGGGGGGYGGGSGSTMVGLGNPNFKDARDEKTWIDSITDAAKAASASGIASLSSHLSNITGSDKRGILFEEENNKQFGFTSNRGPNAFGKDLGGSYSGGGGVSAAAVGTGVWGNQLGSSSSSSSSSSSASSSASTSNAVPGKAGVAASDGSYEAALISPLCEPAGLRPVPPEDKLTAFLSQARTLSPQLVGECLEGVLQSDSWQSRCKALQVISALVRATGCEGHATYWHENFESIKECLKDAKAMVRTQAAKALRTLKVEGADEELEAGSSKANANANANATRSSSSSSSAKSSQPAASSVSLLDDDLLDLAPTSPPPPPPTAISSVPSNIISQAPPPSNLQEVSSGGLFDGMNVEGGGVASMAPPPIPSIAPEAIPQSIPSSSSSSASVSVFDFINGPSPSSASSSSSSMSLDAFDSLSLSTSTPSSSSSTTTTTTTTTNINNAPASTNTLSSTYSSDFAGLSPVTSSLPPSLPPSTGLGPSPIGLPRAPPPTFATSQYQQQHPNLHLSQPPMGSYHSNLNPNPNPNVMMPLSRPPMMAAATPQGPFMQGMMAPNQSAPYIPALDEKPTAPSGGSAFSFIGGGGAGGSGNAANKKGDAFDFVADAMKASISNKGK